MATSPATVMPCAIDDLGILAKLPREIRDEIYRCLVKGDYDVNTGPYYFIDLCLIDTTVLRASKSINREARSVLYSESLFHFSLNISRPLYPEITECPQYPKTFADEMMNISFDIHGLGDYFDKSESWKPVHSKIFKQFCDNTIGYFTGTKITRKYVRVQLYRLPKLTADYFTSPFFEVLKRLVGFRTMTVVLHFDFDLHEREDSLYADRETIQYVSDRAQEGMQAVKKYLVPALGPVADEYLEKMWPICFRATLTFHPLEHLRKKSLQE